jgi:cell division topological specificity factor
MSGFFDRMLGRGRDSGTGQKAKERLQFVLVHDRINLPPERLTEMKKEILGVISKYVKVDTDDVDIALEQRDRKSNKIVAEIPFSQSIDLDDDDDGQPDTDTPSETADDDESSS